MKWIGQHIWSFISRFRADVYLEGISTSSETNVLVVDSDGKITKNTAMSGDITGVTAGTGLSGGGSSGDVTLNVEASQTQITAVGNIATGQWRGTAIGAAYGGTGLTTVGTNEILTGNGGSALTSESTLTYDSETLTIGADDDGTATITRKTHSDEAGGELLVKAGNATGADKNGGTLKLQGGLGTGSGVGGSISFYSHTGGSSGSSAGTHAEIARLGSNGDLQIDGDITLGSTSFVNSSGVIQVANQSNITGVGTISSGTWQGTAVASAYLDADTAHLSGTQTFSGAKTFSSLITAQVSGFAGPTKLEHTYVDAIDKAQGVIVYFGGTTSMTAGAIYYFSKISEDWELVDADAEGSSIGMLGLALGTSSDTHGMLLRGIGMTLTDSGDAGDVLYLATTAGRLTATAPSGTGDIVRIAGFGLHDTSRLVYFNPDNTWVEIA